MLSVANHAAFCLTALDALEVIRGTSIVARAVIAVTLACRLANAIEADLIRRAIGARGASPASLGLVREPERGQRHSHKSDAEFLQRRAPRDGLGQALGQLIEFVVHNFLFIWDLFPVFWLQPLLQ